MRPPCICRHPDRYECMRWRHPPPDTDGADGGYFSRGPEPCDCCCHAADEDGMTGWDDPTTFRPEG